MQFVVSTGDNFYMRGVKNDGDPLWKTVYTDVGAHQTHLSSLFQHPPILTAALLILSSHVWLLQRFGGINLPWYAILGEHDHYGNPDAQVSACSDDGGQRLPFWCL